MKTITLKKLTLQDWRGQNNSVTFSRNTEIKGRNKSGKSSIFNAWLWLMTGADSDDRNNYRLFNEKEEQTYDNSRIASVESVIDVDGMEYTFKKTAKPGWTRKKGREVYEKKSTDDYKFYVDSVERSATEYKKFIEELLAPIEKLKIMLNISQFLKLDWKDMRKHFESMIGEIKESDMKGDYSAIKELMVKFDGNVELVKAHLKPKIKTLKENVGTPSVKGKLEIEIDALTESVKSSGDAKSIQQEIDEAKEQIESIDKQILGSNEQAKVYIEKRNAELAEINKLKQEYAEAETKYNTKPIYEANKIKSQIAEIEGNNAQIERENRKGKQVVADAEREIKLAKERLRAYEECRKVLLKENENVKSMQFEGEVCSYCGQPLRGDKLEEAKQRFFEQKEAKHKSIVATGKANNEKIAQVKKEIEELQAIIDKGYEEKPLQDKEQLTLELQELRDNFVKYSNTKDGKEKLEIIASHEENLTDIPTTDTTALQNMKKELLNDIESNSKKLGDYERTMNTIKSKQEELKNSAVELALLEKSINQCELYEREKAAITKSRLDGMFIYINVVMWSKTKEGNFVDDCRVLDAEGVDFRVTNMASRIRCGIDISLGVQKFFGLNLPLFIDDADLINSDNMPEMDNQLIKLIVTNEDFCVECK